MKEKRRERERVRPNSPPVKRYAIGSWMTWSWRKHLPSHDQCAYLILWMQILQIWDCGLLLSLHTPAWYILLVGSWAYRWPLYRLSWHPAWPRHQPAWRPVVKTIIELDYITKFEARGVDLEDNQPSSLWQTQESWRIDLIMKIMV